MSLFGGRRDGSSQATRATTAGPRREKHKTGDDASQRGSTVANIGKSIVFKGDLSGDEDLQIDGQVDGGVQLANHQLTIGETGRVQVAERGMKVLMRAPIDAAAAPRWLVHPRDANGVMVEAVEHSLFPK